MSNFKIGDTVRLTGENWGLDDAPRQGTIVNITRWLGDPVIEFGGKNWYIGDDGYEAELVTEEPRDDAVHHPVHYTAYKGLEIIDLTRQMPYTTGNIVKYVTRAPFKGNEVQDLEKAQQYLTWAIEDAKARGAQQ